MYGVLTSYPVHRLVGYNPHLLDTVRGSMGGCSLPMLNFSKAPISEGRSETDILTARSVGVLLQATFWKLVKSPNLQWKGSETVSKSGGYFVGNA